MGPLVVKVVAIPLDRHPGVRVSMTATQSCVYSQLGHRVGVGWYRHGYVLVCDRYPCLS